MTTRGESGLKFIYEEAAVVVNSGGGDFLVIGDVHIGAEQKLVRKGVRLYDYVDFMIKKVHRLMDEFALENILILGDVKDSVLYPDVAEADSISRFFNGLEDYNIQITTGNHDAHLDEIVKVRMSDEIFVGDIAFMHGHRWPSEVAMGAKFILAGHNHAAVSLRDKNNGVYTQKAWLVARLNGAEAKKRYAHFNSEVRLVILPAFNDLIVGTPVNMIREGNLSPLFRNNIFNHGNAEVYSLRGELVGTPESIAPA